jgi:hypothetical protein
MPENAKTKNNAAVLIKEKIAPTPIIPICSSCSSYTKKKSITALDLVPSSTKQQNVIIPSISKYLLSLTFTPTVTIRFLKNIKNIIYYII